MFKWAKGQNGLLLLFSGPLYRTLTQSRVQATRRKRERGRALPFDMYSFFFPIAIWVWCGMLPGLVWYVHAENKMDAK